MILIDNIKFSYGKHEVFDNLSLQFGESTILFNAVLAQRDKINQVFNQ